MIVYSVFWLVIICAGLCARRNQSVLAIYLVAFFFIGLRMETGFDWLVYKDVFDRFADGFSWEKIALIQLQYSQETGFLFLVGLLAQLIPNYEVIQAIFTLFFLYSFFKLASEIPGSRPALALAVFLSFFLLSVGLSTVRQALAMSLFNMGLYYFFRGRSPLYIYSFFIFATFIHVSAAAYIIIFIAARMYKKLIGRIGIFSHVALSGALFFALPLVFFTTLAMFPNFSSRAAYYEGITLTNNINLFSIAFAAVMLLTGFVATQKRQTSSEALEKFIILGNMTAIFSSVTFASIFFLTLRDRLAYELIVLFSIYVSTHLSLKNFLSMGVVTIFGLFYQFAILRPPRDLAFVPYQNSLILFISGSESTGVQRSSQYMEIFIEDLLR